MKKIYIIYILYIFLYTELLAEVSLISPSSIYIQSDKKSFKDSGTVNSIYFSTGTLSYLSEFSYTHTDIRYKYSTNNLIQNEITMFYSRFFINHSYKVGIHTNSTTDTDLQNGTTMIIGYNHWNWFIKNKLSYGVELYDSYYTNGRDLKNTKRNIKISQLMTHIDYFSPFILFSNFISLKINYENAYTYNKNLFFLELKNIIYYKTFTFELNYFGGELQTGVLAGGAIVYNSKDIIKNKYGIKIGYQISSNINVNLAYTNILLDEYKSINAINNSTISLNVSYRFR
jgi:hypothetical protein